MKRERNTAAPHSGLPELPGKIPPTTDGAESLISACLL
jgi:hypothetical protein